MKKLLLIAVVALAALAFTYPAELLMEPQELANVLNSNASDKPIVINVGPSGPIKTSKLIGNTEDPSNKVRLQNLLKTIPKDKKIVLYCGCCKLEDCHNIQEAHKILASAKYTNYKILNMPTDFYTDWLSKGYPME